MPWTVFPISRTISKEFFLKIFINLDEIDFIFENEKTLGDIYSSIESWLTPQGFSITEMNLSDKEYFITDKEEWESIPFSGQEEIHFTALTLPQLKAQNLKTLYEYTLMFQNSLKEGNLELMNELLHEYQYIEGSFEILLDDNSHSIRNHMQNLLSSNGFLPEGDRTEQNVKNVLEGFIMLGAVIQGRIEELEDPGKAGNETYETIQSLLPQMEEVSLMLQTGKDKEAMEIIIRFSELFQKLLRIYTNIPEEQIEQEQRKILKREISEMSKVLKELAEAFSNEDSVLLGDLMEYEIMPRMEGFPRFFDSIIKGD